jgi:hypothetical protein
MTDTWKTNLIALAIVIATVAWFVITDAPVIWY